jgi:O-acetyl-ADP-ribose deacetylase (regulator of RNase III)
MVLTKSKYQEIEGDLIDLALEGNFDVIAHGCNCFCIQKAGIAKRMSEVFKTNDFHGEKYYSKGSIYKLGDLSLEEMIKTKEGEMVIDMEYTGSSFTIDFNFKPLTVINAYTQYEPGPNLDYEALTLCLRKINHVFKGKHIGLPQIGCGIAGGIWDVNQFSIKDAESSRKYVQLQQRGFKDVKTIIQEELKDCDITVVIYKK